MINVTIIAVGKLKESYLRNGCLEYIKRLGAYAKTQIIEINEEKCPDNPSENQIKAVIQKEGERILKKIPAGAAVFPLCIEGREYSSSDFSSLIENTSMSNSRICFVIGGSYGLDDKVKEMGKIKLSFGKMTLPHQLARLVLLEQIYRAFSIINNSKYHK